MNIVIFTLGNPANIGGVQLSTARLSDDLIEHGHNLHLFSHFDVPLDEWAYPGQHLVKRHFYKQTDTNENRAAIKMAVMELTPDTVIIINSSQTAGVVISALQGTNIPIILSERGAAKTVIRYNWACAAQRDMIHMMCDASHLLMPSYQEAFPKFLQDQTYIIPSAVPYTNEADLPAFNMRKKQILWVGRMTFEKDVNLLINAFALISTQLEDWTLHLVGDGALSDDLKVQAKKSIASERIVFHGALFDQDLDQVYKNASVFALPSRSEGCPLALREAMGWQLPVIGYADCPGTNEIIKDSVNGYLAQGGDRVQTLADKLLALCQNQQNQFKFGAQARRDAQIYNIDTVHAQWRDMIANTVSSKKIINPVATEKPYHARLLKMIARVQKIGYSRNWIAGKKPTPWHRFLNKSLRNDYFQLYGLPIFDFKSYYEQHPQIKLAGIDPLLHFIRQSPATYVQQDLISIFGDTPQSPNTLISFWKAGDFSSLPDKKQHQWRKIYDQDMIRNVFKPIGLLRFLTFYKRACCWGRQTVWDAISMTGKSQ